MFGRIHKSRRLHLLLVVLLTAWNAAAEAQTWPAKPVRFIASFAAGSAPDIVCRVIAERLSRAFGQQILVDNRPGASNVLGAQAVAHATPDGYTFFFATTASLVTNPYTFKKLPYDPLKDFTPVAMIGKNPFLILVNPTLPAHTLPELVMLDKTLPGSLSFASDGPRNFSGMVGEWLNKLTGAKLVQIPYTVMPQGIQDTIAGRTQIVILAYAAAWPFMADGRLRAIAVTSAGREPAIGTVPTVAETLPGFDFQGWFGVVAPTGTPGDVILRMNREIDRVLLDPEIVQKMTDIGVRTEGADTPEGFGRFIGAEHERWRKVVQEIGLEPE
jgi:tripartite-type tricarboxylate transporter receptor subunit TctC